MIFGTGRFSSSTSRLWTRRQAMTAVGGAVAISLLAGCGGGSGGGNGGGGNGGGGSLATFTGRVVDINSNEAPVQGATIALNGRTTTTAVDGTFILQTPPNSAIANATVTGPNNQYYFQGYWNGAQYDLARVGFPVQAILANESRNLGTVKLGSQNGPPFPPLP